MSLESLCNPPSERVQEAALAAHRTPLLTPKEVRARLRVRPHLGQELRRQRLPNSAVPRGVLQPSDLLLGVLARLGRRVGLALRLQLRYRRIPAQPTGTQSLLSTDSHVRSFG